MKKTLRSVLLCLTLLGANAASAASFKFSFDGNFENHNDIARINFSLVNEAYNVKLWTDSFQDGANFDPITALWNQATGELIDENDDNSEIAQDQTRYDSGLAFFSLPAGDYFFTVAAFSNWAQGNNISDGFLFDGETPIALADWDQPANFQNMGAFWRVNLTYDDKVVINEVPVPAAVWLFGSGLMVLLGFNRKRPQVLAASV